MSVLKFYFGGEGLGNCFGGCHYVSIVSRFGHIRVLNEGRGLFLVGRLENYFGGCHYVSIVTKLGHVNFGWCDSFGGGREVYFGVSV